MVLRECFGKGFTETLNALRAIRDQQLFRETHRDFEAYCRERWGLSPLLISLVQSDQSARREE